MGERWFERVVFSQIIAASHDQAPYQNVAEEWKSPAISWKSRLVKYDLPTFC